MTTFRGYNFTDPSVLSCALKIEEGYRLGVPRPSWHRRQMYYLFPHPHFNPDGKRIAIAKWKAECLLQSDLFAELPERTEQNGKIGWSELGLPGEFFRIYAFRQ
jgi:hypothetical protein